MGYPSRLYTLYPRTTGWQHMIPLIRKSSSYIYDVTIFYVDYTPGERPSEKSLLFGRFPHSIIFHIEPFCLNQLPEDSAESMGVWLNTRFAEKELLLKQFYEESKLPQYSHQLWEHSSPRYWTCLVFWSILLTLFITMIYTSNAFRWYLLFTFFFYTVCFPPSHRLDKWILRHQIK